MPEVVEAWVCDQPRPGVSYQVLRERWIEDADGTYYRIILEIRISEEEEA